MTFIGLLALFLPVLSHAATCGTLRSDENDPNAMDLAPVLLQSIQDVCNDGSPVFPPSSTLISTFNTGLEIWNVSRVDPSTDLSACSAAFTNIIIQCINNTSVEAWGGSWSLNGATFTLDNSNASSNPIAGLTSPDLSSLVQSASQNVDQFSSDSSNADYAAAAAILLLAAASEAAASALLSEAATLQSAAAVAEAAQAAPGPDAASSLASAYTSAASQVTTTSSLTTSIDARTSGSSTVTTGTTSSQGTTSTVATDVSITFPISLDACPYITPEWTTTDTTTSQSTDPTTTTTSLALTTTAQTTEQTTTQTQPLPSPACSRTPFNKLIASAYSTGQGDVSINTLLYSLRQILCSNSCDYPPGIAIQDSDVYPQPVTSDSQGNCELSIGLPNNLELFAYRQTPATGGGQQDCWGALDDIIKGCVDNWEAQGWINGPNGEFFKAGVRSNTDPQALHPSGVYGENNHIVAAST